MHTLNVMDPEGHVVVEWPGVEVKTAEAEAQREKAREVFDAVMERGMTAFATDKANEGRVFAKGSVFDPSVGEMTVIGQVVGG